jgi:hypothetical protein
MKEQQHQGQFATKIVADGLTIDGIGETRGSRAEGRV